MRQDIDDSVELAIFDNPDCLVTDIGGYLGAVPDWPDPLVGTIPAGQEVYLLTFRFDVNVGPSAGGVGLYTRECFELSSFIPDAGEKYTMRYAINSGCRTAPRDSKGRIPASFQIVPLRPECERRYMNFRRAG